jgi:hypothetical protein
MRARKWTSLVFIEMQAWCPLEQMHVCWELGRIIILDVVQRRARANG